MMVERFISLVHMHILENNGEVESRSRIGSYGLWVVEASKPLIFGFIVLVCTEYL